MSKPLQPAGRYVTSTVSGERVRAFVPAPLPPDARVLDLGSLQTILAEANQAVGRLDGICRQMARIPPRPNLFDSDSICASFTGIVERQGNNSSSR